MNDYPKTEFKADDVNIFLHQMGKVGSSTLLAGLNRTPNIKVWHTHTLNKERLARQLDRLEGEVLPKHLERSLRVRDMLAARSLVAKPLKCISATREPIARNISAYFENLGKKADWSVEDLIAHFLSSYKHDIPLTWFDWEIKDVLGIDVFESPFDHSKGYHRYSNDKVDLLVLRQENLPTLLDKGVISHFIGEQMPSQIESKNSGEGKDYKILYKKFKESIRFSENFIETTYRSRYCQHFYTDEEIARFRLKWTTSL